MKFIVFWFTALSCVSTCLLANSALHSNFFHKQAWDDIRPIYAAIVAHPFNQELSTGTLSQARFARYSSQDQLYLQVFSEALKTLIKKVDEADKPMLLKILQEAQSEGAISKDKPPTAMNRAAALYTMYLRHIAATGSREELMSALLPCFWIYREVAMELKLTAKKPNPYQKWLDDYSSKHYSEAVEQMISLSDRYAMKADEKMRMQMETAFVTASWLEWYFWENAYQE